MAKAAAENNLALWDEFSTTDPEFTKSFNRGGFQGTAINPVYITRRLTEKFGPVGIGWRFVIDDEKYVPGHMLPDGVTRAIVHVVRGHLEYKMPGRVFTDGRDMSVVQGASEWVSTGPQFGQTTFVGDNKNGLFTDEEAPKKSVTDCLGKCALQLGIAADISLGLWDDNKYVSDNGGAAPARKPRTPKNAAPAPGAAPAAVSPSGIDLSHVSTAINTTTQPAELLVVMEDLRRSPAIYNDIPTWESVCKMLAAKFQAIGQADTNEAKMIVGVLQAEYVRINTAKAGINAPPQQQAIGHVPSVPSGAPGVPA